MAQPQLPALVPGSVPPQKGTSTLAIVLIVVGSILFLIVVVGSILLALGIYGVRRYVAQAKLAEGRSAVGQMAKDVIACIHREEMAGNVVSPTEPRKKTELPPTTAPVPASFGEVRGRKYMSSPSDWTGPGWDCIRFSMRDPQYFQYQWRRASTTTGEIVARADLDGDGAADATFKLPITCTESELDFECTVPPSIHEIIE